MRSLQIKLLLSNRDKLLAQIRRQENKTQIKTPKQDDKPLKDSDSPKDPPHQSPGSAEHAPESIVIAIQKNVGLSSQEEPRKTKSNSSKLVEQTSKENTNTENKSDNTRVLNDPVENVSEKTSSAERPEKFPLRNQDLGAKAQPRQNGGKRSNAKNQTHESPQSDNTKVLNDPVENVLEKSFLRSLINWFIILQRWVFLFFFPVLERSTSLAERPEKVPQRNQDQGANAQQHQKNSGKRSQKGRKQQKISPSENDSRKNMSLENDRSCNKIKQGQHSSEKNDISNGASQQFPSISHSENKPKNSQSVVTIDRSKKNAPAIIQPIQLDQQARKKSVKPQGREDPTEAKGQYEPGPSGRRDLSKDKPLQHCSIPASEKMASPPEIFTSNASAKNQSSGMDKPTQKNAKKVSVQPIKTLKPSQKDLQTPAASSGNKPDKKIQENQTVSSSKEKCFDKKNDGEKVKLTEINNHDRKKSGQLEQQPQTLANRKAEQYQEAHPGDKNKLITNKFEETLTSAENFGASGKQKTITSGKWSTFRPFSNHDENFKYVKDQVLPPETGVIDLITPCHEYKSLSTAATLDRPKLLAKLRSETFRFAAACLNVRSNGTIHFGIMDSVEDKGYEHGQIVGIPIKDKNVYADLLNDLDKCFPEESERAAARACICSPDFIEVIDVKSTEKRFVVEVDIKPQFSIVEGKTFQVCLPKFEKNRTIYTKKTTYERIGTKSQTVNIEEELNAFNQRRKEADKRRKQAEEANVSEGRRYENLGRRLSLLLTNGKQYFDDTLHYVLVTNRCESHHLQHLTFLRYLKILCVFDFDADSDTDGLCSKCKDYHATNMYSLQSYASEYGKNMDDIINNLGLFKHTSWIFCNGRKSFLGEDTSCDEQTWIKEKMKYFKRSVSFICNDIIKRGCFIVLFMLFTPVEMPLVKAFSEFYEEMSGMEYIMCVTESAEYYEQWAGLAQASCSRTDLDQRSVVGMKLSHVDATVQEMIPKKDFNRKLPVSTKGVCILKIPLEEKMNSLNILCINECENTNLKGIEPKKLEGDFYCGGKISWKHFWLAEQKKCGVFIERQACQEVEEILDGILNKDTVKLPVARINIVHQPGSGGSTVARQILWKNKKKLRCAIVNSIYQIAKVCEHAVQLREYEERDTNSCLPVLLLLEDCAEEYIDDLKNNLQEAMIHKKVGTRKPCFILLSCRRSNAPEKFCAASPDNTVAITHKLRKGEQMQFKAKAEELHANFSSQDKIIIFVLMSEEFNKKYLEDFVKNVMGDLDHSSSITRLIRYVALLNHYVQNSYISLSHCEVLLGIQAHVASVDGKLSQNRDLYSLSEQALIIEVKDEITFISAIRILHPLIAEEILNQFSNSPTPYPQSKIALGLLEETAALNHRFGKQEFVTFIKHLFFRRHRKSRGDNADSFFSPLIEHVCKVEKDIERAIELLRVAYEQFNKDPHFAQQLARIHYKYHKFEEAKKWVQTAKAKLPDDSYILDTEGRLYKEWFNANLDKYHGNKSAVDEISLIELGLKSMECFRAAQKAEKCEKDVINNSGYFGEVDVGCSLLDLLLILFGNIEKEKSELVKYLTDEKYIPKELKNPWAKLHKHLKGLYQCMYTALEWISEDVGCFQTDRIDVWESTTREDVLVPNARKWLVKKTQKFAEYFRSSCQLKHSASAEENQFARRMEIYRLGGSSVATILSLLSNTSMESPGSELEAVINCYPREISEDQLDDTDLINLIMCHIALGSVCSESTKLFSFEKLLEISQRFLNDRKPFPASAYFLIFMLYWPDEKFLMKQYANKTNILKNAIENARQLHGKRIKNVPVRRKRTNVLFFLGQGFGLQKFIFRGAIEQLLKHPLNERTFRWDSDAKDRELIHNKLKKVHGWTENGKVYTKSSFGKIEVLPLNYSSVPHGDENVSFYLGFTYIGYVTYGIQVTQDYR
ncbi:sterile alpha motif domain-containing protein 9-like isoform X2 [Hyperolius riggenbachi]